MYYTYFGFLLATFRRRWGRDKLIYRNRVSLKDHIAIVKNLFADNTACNGHSEVFPSLRFLLKE